MKGAAVIFFCAMALVFGEDVALVNGCPADPIIHKVLPHPHCDEMYICNGVSLIAQRCPANLLFNVEREVCDWPENVECGDRVIPERNNSSQEVADKSPIIHGHGDPSLAPQICAQPDSNYVLVAHENCNQFYLCQGGRPILFNCPENLLFNYTTGICDWPNNVECGNRTVAVNNINVGSFASPASCPQNNKDRLIPHENCNQFYVCYDGSTSISMFCPPGLVFDYEKQYCDLPSKLDCANRPIVEFEERSNGFEEDDVLGVYGHSEPSQASAICAAANSEGALVAHENCNQFYKCSRGFPVAMDCYAGLLYNPNAEVCDWPQNVECGDRNH